MEKKNIENQKDYLNENVDDNINYSEYGCGKQCYSPGGHLHEDYKINYSDYICKCSNIEGECQCSNVEYITEPYQYKGKGDLITDIGSNSLNKSNIKQEHLDLISQMKRAKQRNETIVKDIEDKHNSLLRELKKK